jgi:hypothetical protein
VIDGVRPADAKPRDADDEAVPIRHEAVRRRTGGFSSCWQAGGRTWHVARDSRHYFLRFLAIES